MTKMTKTKTWTLTKALCTRVCPFLFFFFSSVCLLLCVKEGPFLLREVVRVMLCKVYVCARVRVLCCVCIVTEVCFALLFELEC